MTFTTDGSIYVGLPTYKYTNNSGVSPGAVNFSMLGHHKKYLHLYLCDWQNGVLIYTEFC